MDRIGLQIGDYEDTRIIGLVPDGVDPEEYAAKAHALMSAYGLACEEFRKELMRVQTEVGSYDNDDKVLSDLGIGQMETPLWTAFDQKETDRIEAIKDRNAKRRTAMSDEKSRRWKIGLGLIKPDLDRLLADHVWAASVLFHGGDYPTGYYEEQPPKVVVLKDLGAI